MFAQTYDGSVAVEAATGAVRWRSGTRAGYAESSGVIADGVWVIPNGDYTDGNLAALDLATGEVLWQAADAGAGMTFAVGGDLIVGRNAYEFIGYDLLTGEKVWDGGTPDPTNQTRGGATIAGGRIYVSVQDGTKAYGLP